MSSNNWRVLAQRLLTKEWLSWDVPLRDAGVTRTLSGPGAISGNITPELAQLKADDGRPLIEQWSTALYVEVDGRIRNGAIVTNVETSGASRAITSAGFSGYPTGIPYMDDYMPTTFEDPLTVFRNIWSYVQSFPDGNLGLVVDPSPSTWMRLGSGDGPYRISWFENKDCGQELENIAQSVPFDYLEHHSWNGSRTDVNHFLEVGFPRLGARRDDLMFQGGMNVTAVSTVTHDGERFANDVYLLGPGEGRAMLRARASQPDGRLRRCAVIPYKHATQGFLDRRAPQELASRRGLIDIPSFTVEDHPSAPMAAIMPGDDVLLSVDLEWEGQIDVWLRVLEIDESQARVGEATLKTMRSEFFNYVPAESPTGQIQPISM